MILSAHMAFATMLSSDDMLSLYTSLDDALSAKESPEEIKIRPLAKGESIAFKGVFGTSDMAELLEIERDPVVYWEEREKALKDEAIPHIEFCKQYAEEAKLYIQAAASPPEIYKPWFYYHPNAIEYTIQSKIPESHPAYPTFLALYTAFGCDYLTDPKSVPVLHTPEDLLESLEKSLEYEGLTSEFNESQIWVMRDNAHFSVFDSLVALSNGQDLCGFMPFHTRASFRAHEHAGSFGEPRWSS